MKTAFIFHGTEGNPGENWIPWLKEKIEQEGYAVHIPEFPTPGNQSLETWKKVFKEYKEFVDRNTIFIGHSVGSAFTLNLLEEMAVQSSFLVCPFLSSLNNPDFDELNSTFIEKNFDWTKIKEHCNDFYIYYSDNDPYVPQALSESVAKKLSAKKFLVKNAGHFNKRAGYTKFEELWDKLEPLLH